MIRWAMGEMWMWQWWRVVVVYCASKGIAVEWLGRNTPLLYVLHMRALEDRDFTTAAEIASVQNALAK